MLNHQSTVAFGADLELDDAGVVMDLFEDAAHANLESALRRGATVYLRGAGQLLMTGDLHDHRGNLQRMIRLARLDESKDHHLIVHEVIHGRNLVEGRDMSVDTIARVAALKLRYPDQVHILLSNHELAQVTGEGVAKENKHVVEHFDDAVDHLYEDDADDVRDAMGRYVRSLPLAVKTENGVLCCHSLPAPEQIDSFDASVVHRVPTDEDLTVGGAAYCMVWGRNHDRQVFRKLSQAWGAEVIIVGHQQSPSGYHVLADSILVLASEHDRGVALPIDLWKIQTLDKLVSAIVPLASVDVQH